MALLNAAPRVDSLRYIARASILGCLLGVLVLPNAVAAQTQTTERVSTTSGGLQPGAIG